MKQKTKVTAKEVEAALRNRHGNDYFFEQVKIGPGGSRIMDGYAIEPTWSPVKYIGYEIKVSRSDFISDDKYHEYLPYCHEFYFVAPSGIIQVEELPPGIGLLVYYPKSGTLRMKRKAARNKIEGFNPAIHHIFMWKLEKYNRWSTEDILKHHEGKIERKAFGKSVAMKISDLNESIRFIKYDSEKLKRLKKKVKENFGATISIDDIIDSAINAKDGGNVVLEEKVKNLEYTINSIKRIIKRSEEK